MKKVVSLLLVVVLALGMSTMAFAKITEIKSGAAVKAGTAMSSPKKSMDNIVPGEKLYITFTKDISTIFNTDGTGTNPSTAGVTKTDNSRGKVLVKTKIAKGANLIEEVVWDYTTTTVDNSITGKFGRIKVEFIDPFVNNDTDGSDFDFEVFLQIDGERYDDDAYTWSYVGTLVNGTVGDIDADTDYVNLDGGYIVSCVEYSKNVEYYLGNGVSLIGKAFKDKDYYGYSTVDTTDAQEVLIDKYGIDEVYNLKCVGLQAVTERVVFTDADPDYYVYAGDASGNIKYLGQVKDANFEYYATYYLAAKKLDIDDEEIEEEEEEFPEAPPVTGDSDYADNDNFNPSTGA